MHIGRRRIVFWVDLSQVSVRRDESCRHCESWRFIITVNTFPIFKIFYNFHLPTFTISTTFSSSTTFISLLTETCGKSIIWDEGELSDSVMLFTCSCCWCCPSQCALSTKCPIEHLVFIEFE